MKIKVCPTLALPDDVSVVVVQSDTAASIMVAADLDLHEACEALTEVIQGWAEDYWMYVGAAAKGAIA